MCNTIEQKLAERGINVTYRPVDNYRAWFAERADGTVCEIALNVSDDSWEVCEYESAGAFLAECACAFYDAPDYPTALDLFCTVYHYGEEV